MSLENFTHRLTNFDFRDPTSDESDPVSLRVSESLPLRESPSLLLVASLASSVSELRLRASPSELLNSDSQY